MFIKDKHRWWGVTFIYPPPPSIQISAIHIHIFKQISAIIGETSMLRKYTRENEDLQIQVTFAQTYIPQAISLLIVSKYRVIHWLSYHVRCIS